MKDQNLREAAFEGRLSHVRWGSGSVLILTLIVLSMMTAVTVGLAYRSRLQIRMAYESASEIQAYHLALGGIDRMRAALECYAGPTDPNIARLCHVPWTSAEAGLFADGSMRGLPKTPQLNCRLYDEQSLFHLSGQFTHVFEDAVGRDWATRILDWQDEDDDPLAFESAESDFYAMRSIPYRAKNRPITLLRELLFLRDLSPDLYSAPAQATEEKPIQIDWEKPLLGHGLDRVFTAYGTDRLNFNTVSTELLQYVGGLERLSSADVIDAFRSGEDGRYGTDDDRFIRSSIDLPKDRLNEVETSVLSDPAKFCFGSDYYRVVSRATIGPRVSYRLSATLHYDGGRYSVLSMERVP